MQTNVVAKEDGVATMAFGKSLHQWPRVHMLLVT